MDPWNSFRFCMEQIDSLDTLALLGDRERFTAAVEWIGKNLRFNIVSIALLAIVLLQQNDVCIFFSFVAIVFEYMVSADIGSIVL